MRAPLLEGACRLPFEVHDPETVRSCQHLAEVVVAVDKLNERLGRERFEDRQLLDDPRRELLQDTPGVALCDVECALELAAGS